MSYRVLATSLKGTPGLTSTVIRPKNFVTVTALLTALAYALDLKEAAAITSFALLCIHLTVNLSAIRLRKKMLGSTGFRVPFYPLIPSLGLLSCIILMFSLPQESWVVAAVVMAVSFVFYLLKRKSLR